MTEQIRTTNYNATADFLRSLACVLVICLHVFGEYLAKSATFDSSWWIINLVQTVGKVAVPFFILLSGNLLLDQNKTYTTPQFYKKRLARIGWPLLIWPLFYYFSFLILSHRAFSVSEFIHDYVFLKTFYHIYFLYIIFGLYLVTPYLKKIFFASNDQEQRWFVCGSFFLSIMVSIFVYFTRTHLNYWSIFTVFLPFICYFVAGEYFKKITLSQQRKFMLGLIFLLSFSVSACLKYVFYSQQNLTAVRYLDDVLSVNVILMSLSAYQLLMTNKEVAVFAAKPFWKRLFLNISTYSFGIYILHPCVLFLFNKLQLFEQLAFLPIWSTLSLKAAAVFLVSCIIVIILKKLPLSWILLGN